jgi:hypothetical protein
MLASRSDSYMENGTDPPVTALEKPHGFASAQS